MTVKVPQTTGLAIAISPADERTVIELRGALDAATAPQLFAQFAELSRGGALDVDLEISRLEFMDSSGLSVIVAEHKRIRASGGSLIIHHPRRHVIRLFQLHGLMSYLVVEPRMSI
jgi:anti-sigma B factor antagonist